MIRLLLPLEGYLRKGRDYCKSKIVSRPGVVQISKMVLVQKEKGRDMLNKRERGQKLRKKEEV